MKIDRQPTARIWKEFSIIGSQTELSVLTNWCPACVSSHETEQPWQEERWYKDSKPDPHVPRLRSRSRVQDEPTSLLVMFFAPHYPPQPIHPVCSSRTWNSKNYLHDNRGKQEKHSQCFSVKCLILSSVGPETKFRRWHSPSRVVPVHRNTRIVAHHLVL